MPVFDEMNGVAGGARLRAPYEQLKQWLAQDPRELLDTRRSQAELFFRRNRHHLCRLR